MAHDIPVFEGQGWLQVGELVLAFVLSAAVGLERQLRRKSAGMRTQAIVGTSAALFLLVSKYGFMDVLSDNIVLDPSRVAAQIVSGIGFLGAGLILTRRGTVRGLTTAASVWETAAIGMAAGAGLWLLAVLVAGLHFVVAYGFDPIKRLLPGGQLTDTQLEISYEDQHGLLRRVLHATTSSGWTVTLAESTSSDSENSVLVLGVNGRRSVDLLIELLARIDGVRRVHVLTEEDTE